MTRIGRHALFDGHQRARQPDAGRTELRPVHVLDCSAAETVVVEVHHTGAAPLQQLVGGQAIEHGTRREHRPVQCRRQDSGRRQATGERRNAQELAMWWRKPQHSLASDLIDTWRRQLLQRIGGPRPGCGVRIHPDIAGRQQCLQICNGQPRVAARPRPERGRERLARVVRKAQSLGDHRVHRRQFERRYGRTVHGDTGSVEGLEQLGDHHLRCIRATGQHDHQRTIHAGQHAQRSQRCCVRRVRVVEDRDERLCDLGDGCDDGAPGGFHARRDVQRRAFRRSGLHADHA